jgi:uncharacterized protein (TIGR03083 family)
MRITPRYDGSPIIDIPAALVVPLAPLVRQRRRLAAMLATLDDGSWVAQSRCTEWTVRDVVAHLADVNGFWSYAIESGAKGEPTRLLDGFDPAATPALLVSSAKPSTHHEVLARFTATNDALIAVLERLSDDEWGTSAECPVGHLPIALVAAHALWDGWVHERDIAIPLGLPCAIEHDEITTSIVYATALGPALGLTLGRQAPGRFAVETTDPAFAYTLDVGDRVVVHAEPDGLPRLSGPAEQLLEAVSLRAPLPASAPPAWRELLNGLATAFDAPMTDPDALP